jgi:hypothetical protein
VTGDEAERNARLRGWAVAALLAVFAPLAPARAASGLETAVKATYLYKFAPFVEWPAAAFEGAASPFYLCVQGEDPFGPVLDNAVAGQRIGQHPIVVRRMQRIEHGLACHILYVSGSRAQSAAEALRTVRGSGVLTVTDATREPGVKGDIHFILKDGRVRFEIDDVTASADGLVISSKLLNLALAVRMRR